MSQDIIAQIKSSFNIIDIVNRYVTLEKKGQTYWACCPFHQENTPSFSVSPQGFFHCFSCGKKGDLFTFIQEYERLPFVDVVKKLSEELGLDYSSYQNSSSQIKYKEKQELIILNTKITNTFSYFLHKTPEGYQALSYIQKRKISHPIISLFQLGYAPARKYWLYEFLESKNYDQNFLKKSSLFSRNHAKYAFFMHRLIFPIKDYKGEIVGFGGRSLSKEQEPKYLNLPETIVYHKKNLLFGLYESLQSHKNLEEIILCEGYIDVLSFFESGLSYACAPLGTAFTVEQSKLLKRYVKRVILAFDQDNAGQNASFKSLSLLYEQEIDVYIISFDQGQDPAEILEKQSAQHLVKLYEGKQDAFEFLSLQEFSKLQKDTYYQEHLMVFLNKYILLLKNITQEAKKERYLEYLSRLTSVSVKALEKDLLKTSDLKPVISMPKQQNSQNAQQNMYDSEWRTFLFALKDEQKLRFLFRHIIAQDFSDTSLQVFYKEVESQFLEIKQIKMENYLNKISQIMGKTEYHVYNIIYNSIYLTDKEFCDNIKRLKQRNLELRKEELLKNAKLNIDNDLQYLESLDFLDEQMDILRDIKLEIS